MDTVPETAKILNDELPASVISRIARETGAVQRVFKVSIVTLVWTVVLTPKKAGAVTLSAMKSLYEALSSTSVASSAFQYRFNERFAELMKACAEYLLGKTRELKAVAPLFGEFSDVQAIDSSLIKLPDCLSTLFPGPRNNTAPAAMKVNAVYSVVRSTLEKVAIAEGTKAEVKFLEIDESLKNRLLLFDLGYFSFPIFRRIDKVGAFFVSRLKSRVNPRIVADNAAGPGRRRQLVGKKLSEAIKNLSRSELDVVVEVYPRATKKKLKVSKSTKKPRAQLKPARFRVVGVRHPETDELHLYVTNVPKDAMTPEQVRVAYTARWFVELVFKELKSDCGMDQIPSKKKSVVEALVYASIIRLLLSRKVVDGLVARVALAAEQLKGQASRDAIVSVLRKRTTTRRAVKALCLFGPMLLPEVVSLATGRELSGMTLDMFFLAAIIDPNTDRLNLAARIDSAKPVPTRCIDSREAA